MNHSTHLVALLLFAALATACSSTTGESSPAYQAACQGAPLGSAEKRNEAMENGYEINRQFDCIDRASYARVTQQQTDWNKANPGAAAAAQRDLEARRVEEAVIGVLGIEDLVQRMESSCVPLSSSGAERYRSAATHWRERNGETAARAHRALSSTFDAGPRQRIEQAIQLKNRQMFAAVLGAPPADQRRWCDGSAAEIDDGRLDVFGKPRLSGPLQGYASR